MPHPAHVRPDEDDEPEEEEDEDDEEEEKPAPRRRTHPRPRRNPHRERPPPVRRWRAPDSDEEEDEEPSALGAVPSQRKLIYWRARDSLFFEPLVALAIVVILLVSLFAYTQNWPPIYVVESGSMQHGSNDQLGLINTGDLVLAQKTSLSGITPYVSGLPTGYSTYGEYGDVLLYWPNGQGSTPVIHRAILYMQWDPHGFYNITDLAGLPCGTQSNPVYAYIPAHGPANCNTTRLTGGLDLYDIGWKSVNISLVLSAPALGDHSGFLTMGDNNTAPDQSGAGVAEISSLVEPGWIIGVARGMIPWFGAVKLLLQGQAGQVPAQSWEFLGLTVVGLILVAFGIHYALRTEGIETPLRREEDEEARAEAEAAPESAPRRWLSKLRRRHSEDEEEEDEDVRPRPRTRPPPSHTPSRRGRPAPHVRRNHKPAKKSDSDDEL
ncbi:MAG TPA: S26 family signal peptidase [Thermoplasmata archaeon]|nr:S26 family signal peptidase [Thermoplasmata archaeon]